MSGYKSEQINEAIALPSEWIKSDDGREFSIKQWNPRVKTGSVIEIEMVCIVKMPDGKIAVT